MSLLYPNGDNKQGEITMINNLFVKASEKKGNQTKLAKELGITQGRLSEFKNYKAGDKRKPNDETILKIADILGLDKGETLYKAKLELEPEKAYLWEWCARRESNPRPSASEVVSVQLLVTFIYNIVSRLSAKRPSIARNLNERNALCYQYRHDQVSL